MSKWPFSDPENVMTITMRQIVREGHPVLLVVRDQEDGSWQFLTGSKFTVADGMMVLLKNIVALDSSLIELADLPVGWQASRIDKGQPWIRVQCEPVESE
jgi:hypothetical protein